MASMYVAMLLVDWKVLRTTPDSEAGDEADYDIYIGRSEMAMWVRVVSSWICILLYGWSLLVPLAMLDRFDDCVTLLTEARPYLSRSILSNPCTLEEESRASE